jgi:hypothetical protein
MLSHTLKLKKLIELCQTTSATTGEFPDRRSKTLATLRRNADALQEQHRPAGTPPALQSRLVGYQSQRRVEDRSAPFLTLMTKLCCISLKF